MKVTIVTGNSENIFNKEGLKCYTFPETTKLDSKKQVEWVNALLQNEVSNQIAIITCNDHIINRLRVAHKEKEVELRILFFSFDESIEEPFYIEVDKNGKLSHYPNGLLDETYNQLIKLL